MLTVQDHPDWSDAVIARTVDVHPGQLTAKRSPQYQAAAAMARGKKHDRTKGRVTVDPDSGLCDVEAYSDADDPAQADWNDE